TTYSNIAKVHVKKGEKLKTGGQIGTIGRDSNEEGYVLHFEIWRNKSKENPGVWVKKL
ncbi:MAG TPA: M23 family metallopeptidase, partial [Flavobacteriales bacterium]|nr:M23 family metallopeptidase [Flavobacteriales bacterium]